MIFILYQVQRKDIREGAKIISKAFHNDPKIRFFIPNDDVRKKRLYYLWEFLLKDGTKNGEVYSPSLKLEGIAIWYPPKKAYISIWRSLLSGALKITRKIGMSTIMKMNQSNKVVKDIHIKLLPKLHWYLALLAVDPNLQKKGYASQLIKFMYEKIEEKREPIYLETKNPKNISLYERFGFNVVEELIIPNTKIVNWSIVIVLIGKFGLLKLKI